MLELAMTTPFSSDAQAYTVTIASYESDISDIAIPVPLSTKL